jgi:hypothetical protein
MPANTPHTDQMLKSFNNSGGNKAKMIAVVIVVVLAGIVSGGMLSGRIRAGGPAPVTQLKTTSTQAGVEDSATFKDTAQGVLKEGGIKGEGRFHLERPGGVSQNVYLNSTVIDMSSFVDKKVQVWGETVAGKRAGWLMDVGKIKVLE